VKITERDSGRLRDYFAQVVKTNLLAEERKKADEAWAQADRYANSLRANLRWLNPVHYVETGEWSYITLDDRFLRLRVVAAPTPEYPDDKAVEVEFLAVHVAAPVPTPEEAPPPPPPPAGEPVELAPPVAGS
jgi:hypothetical protein